MGLDTRSTMDLDTTLLNYPLTEKTVEETINEICRIDMKDDVSFQLVSIKPIRRDDHYGGFCVRIDAVYAMIVTPLSIDISTGDVITPSAIEYEFSGIFDEKVRIRLWGYNIETVLAEKMETILSRGIFNTRPRDFYDIYILVKTQKYSKRIFAEALKASAGHRGSLDHISDVSEILQEISASGELRKSWEKYQKRYLYAREIDYDDIMDVLEEMTAACKLYEGKL